MGPCPKFAEICKPDQARARRLAGRLSPSPKISGPDPTLVLTNLHSTPHLEVFYEMLLRLEMVSNLGLELLNTKLWHFLFLEHLLQPLVTTKIHSAVFDMEHISTQKDKCQLGNTFERKYLLDHYKIFHLVLHKPLQLKVLDQRQVFVLDPEKNEC